MTLAIPMLATERLILRGWREDDFAPIAAFYDSDPDSVFVGGPRRGNDVAMWFMARLGQWALRGYGAFVIAERNGGAFVGWCGVNHYVDTPEPVIQWALLAAQRGKGFMIEAARPALQFIFAASQRLVLHTTIHPANGASQKVALRLGGLATGVQVEDDGHRVDEWVFHSGGAA